MEKTKHNKYLSFVLAIYLFSVPNDFLTGRYLSGIGLSTLLSIFIIIWAVIQVLVSGKIYAPTDMRILLFLLVIGLIPIIFTNVYPIGKIVTFVYYIIFSLAFVNLLHWNKINTDRLILFTFLGVLVMCIYLLMKGTLGYGGMRLVTVERDLNPNVASGYILVGLGAIISIYKNKKTTIIYLFPTGVLLVTMLLLQSKTSLIALILTLMIVGLIVIWERVKSKSLTISGRQIVKFLSMGTILFFIAMLLLDKIESHFHVNIFEVSRIDMLFSGNLDIVTTGRSSIWINALKNSNILMGSGMFTFREVYGRPPHSLYVSTLVETGIIGLSSIIAYFLYYYQKSWKIMFSNYRSYLQQIFIISNLVVFGFGNDVMEYKFFWLGILLWHVIYSNYINGLE